MTVTIRPLQERDLPAADRVMRLAFGTFLGLPDPMAFMGDTAYVRTRWRAAPANAFGAERAGELVGSNFATHWGSVGFFGPLTVHPDCWNQGIASRLLEPVMALFEQWGTRHTGLFTFAQSPRHVHLYQKFGFWPQFLTSIMMKPVAPVASGRPAALYSAVPEREREGWLSASRHLTDSVFEGLDLTGEMSAVATQGLGDTVLLGDAAELEGLAVCHCGPGTEAGSGTCYLKFGAVRSGPQAGSRFTQLLEACEDLARSRGLERLTAGVNTGRHQAYRQMLAHGFRPEIQGVAMHRPNAPGYNRPDVYAIDDWR
jgi:GNAT superfamily N-acetyltransferase